MAMTTEQRNAARAKLVSVRDAAHQAITELDKADYLGTLGELAADAIPSVCASACEQVDTLCAEAEDLALMKSACELGE